MERVILFDGKCNLCNHSVQFIIRRDPKAQFKFASLHSDVGKQLLKRNSYNQSSDSIIFIDNNKCYSASAAVLRICFYLKGYWKLFSIFLFVPTPVRDYVYRMIAKNRYRWFGKQDNCIIPSSKLKDRFL